MKRRERGRWGPRRVLDETTRQVLIGNEEAKARASAAGPSIAPPPAPAPDDDPGAFHIPAQAKEERMRNAPFGTVARSSEAIASWENEGGHPVPPLARAASRPGPRPGKRAEDTGAGCRANAAADLARAHAPGGDYMRVRLEHSAAVWAERAELLERLEKKFQRRLRAA